MSDRSQSFDLQNKSYDEIQNIMENILKNNLSLSTKTKRLGKSLLRINYFDDNVEAEKQKDNRITILQEQEKRVYIQIKGKLTDAQVRQLWSALDKKLKNSTNLVKNQKLEPIKEDVIQEITRLIKLKGYIVKNEEVKTFIENFTEKFNRLPKKDEFDSIVKGYIIMTNEDHLLKKVKIPIKNELSAASTDSVLDIVEDNKPLNSYNNRVVIIEDSIGRRKCPSCGDETSIHEMTDKTIVLMDYPRIYGKKKYCGLCGFEWK
ncbi:MAG: hypothetical protein JSV62_03145 [Promethearchaeota archaeon]|nr:MAG: hypothetical protein JSV62_03145 [Candidatus Lokiarchaeota archaeon]